MKHKWDGDGEHCLDCGDPDWCAGPECQGSIVTDRQHEESEGCWCNPEIAYVDPDSGAKVIVHRGIQ